MGRMITGRVTLIAMAVGVALSIWGIARLAGLDLELKDGAPSEAVEVGDVIGSVIAAGVLASVVHAAMLHFGWARWWPFVGSTALAISMIGPSYYSDGADVFALIAMHFAVAIILIAGFARLAAAECDDGQVPGRRAPFGQPH